MGGHYCQKILHTGTGEKENPVLPMGWHKKTLVGHRKLVVKSKQASTVGQPSSCSGLLIILIDSFGEPEEPKKCTINDFGD